MLFISLLTGAKFAQFRTAPFQFQYGFHDMAGGTQQAKRWFHQLNKKVLSHLNERLGAFDELL
jgi:hypothetical protein